MNWGVYASFENCKKQRLSDFRLSAALMPDGLQRTVLLLAITKPARLYVSTPIFSEYRIVFSRPELRIRRGLRLQFLQLLKNRAHLVSPSQSLQITTDPADNIFLECADAARADNLVAGKQRHFPKFWKKTKIITSRELIGIVAPHLVPDARPVSAVCALECGSLAAGPSASGPRTDHARGDFSPHSPTTPLRSTHAALHST